MQEGYDSANKVPVDVPKEIDIRFDRPLQAGRELTIDERLAQLGTIDDRRKLLAFHEMLCRRAMAIMDKKNSDYGARTDPFRNFHGFGAFGILVRKSDKMARLRTFLEKLERGENMAVIDESWLDTLLDDINYAILFAGYIKTFGAQK